MRVAKDSYRDVSAIDYDYDVRGPTFLLYAALLFFWAYLLCSHPIAFHVRLGLYFIN